MIETFRVRQRHAHKLTASLVLAAVCVATLAGQHATAGQTPGDPGQQSPGASPKARLRVIATGKGSGLAYFDGEGRVRALLGATEYGPGLAFLDAAGENRAWSGFRASGVVVCLRDTQGLLRLELELKVTRATLVTFRANGKPRTGLVVAGHQSGAAFFGARGQPRAACALGEYLPALARFDEQGKLISEPLHHLLPSLFADGVKTSARFVQGWRARPDTLQAQELPPPE